MGPLDALWHLLNFFAPAVGVSAIAATLTKLLWRRRLAGTRFVQLAGWASVSAALVLVAGLIVFGHDGKMATYGVMVLAIAATLFWKGF